MYKLATQYARAPINTTTTLFARSSLQPTSFSFFVRGVALSGGKRVFSPTVSGKLRSPLLRQSRRFSNDTTDNTQQQQKNKKQEEQKERRQEESRAPPKESLFQYLIRRYLELLDSHPIMTKAVSSAVIVSLGDVFAQVLVDHVRSWDDFNFGRFARMFLLGGLVVGPWLHAWYGFLARFFPQPGFRGSIPRLILDQSVNAPLFIVAIFGFMCTLEGRLDTFPKLLETQWWEATKTNWMLWIPAMFFTFRYVPPKFQVLTGNCVALVWNTYLSWAGHKSEAKKTGDEQDGHEKIMSREIA